MTYYDSDGSILEVVPVPAGASVVANGPKSLPYKEMVEETAEDFYRLYRFIGWSTREGDTTPLEWTDATIERSNRDRRFYPVFAKDSVYNNVLPEEFCQLNEEGRLSIKTGYSIRGKITLPAMVNGQRVTGVGDAFNNKDNGFARNTNLTAIFWQEGATPQYIDRNAFEGATSLQWFEFPSTIQAIYSSAFYSCGHLHNRDLSHLTTLDNIGVSAFNNAFAANDNPIYPDYGLGELLLLPASLTALNNVAFGYNNNPTVYQLGGSGAPSQLQTFGRNVLDNQNGYSHLLRIYTNDLDKPLWSEVMNRLETQQTISARYEFITT